MAYYFITFHQIGWFSFICHLLFILLSDLYITKNCVFCWYTTAEKQSLNHVDFYLKPHFLIKSGYHIVPSPFIALRRLFFRGKGVFFLFCDLCKETQLTDATQKKPKKQKSFLFWKCSILDFLSMYRNLYKIKTLKADFTFE